MSTELPNKRPFLTVLSLCTSMNRSCILGRIPLSNPAANWWPTGDPFPMERIWATNRWPTGGPKAPGRQTPALLRISKNRRAGNFYAIWGGAQISKNRWELRLGRINYLIINYLIINYLTIILHSLQVLCVCLIKMSIKWQLSVVIMQRRPIYGQSPRFFGSSVCTQQWAQPFTAGVLWII